MNLIRKIIIGQNPKDAMAYYIGMTVGSAKIDTIIFDEEAMVRFQILRYRVYINDPEQGTMLWKDIVGMPVVVEYDCRFK
tara:strand:+ start:476 stop:715 length:240 start_codon:yes stop_codon:yes gene_type:complete